MKINEIFYSIQGEGYHTGRPTVFVRFSGCNLACPFCDTQHVSGKIMQETQILQEIRQYTCDFVVLTGGEPLLQVTPSFISALHEAGKFVAVETNGTIDASNYAIDWVTCSPKTPFCNAELNVVKCDEVKLVVNEEINVGMLDYFYDNLDADFYYLQPCDTGDKEKNEEIINHTIQLAKENPKWRISLQTQKILNVR